MIKTIPRQTAFFSSICVFCFFLLISCRSYFDWLVQADRTHEYFFNATSFLKTFLLCLIPAFLMLLSLQLFTKTFCIDNDKIEVKYFLKNKEFLLLKNICEITWSSREGQAMSSGSMARRSISRNDSIILIFNDGRKLKIGVNEYSNFDELRKWFLDYGRENGIIKIKPLAERKRNRLKQKSR